MRYAVLRLIWPDVEKVKPSVNIGQKGTAGDLDFYNSGVKGMITPLFGMSCETEIRFITASGQKRVSDDNIITLRPRIVHPSLIVPTPWG